jgi:hypothetical protein
MQVMMPAKKFENWKAQAEATLLVIRGVAIPEVAILEAAIQGVVTQEVAIPAVAATLEAIPAGFLAGVTQGAEVEDPPGEGRTLKTIPKCSR